MKHNHNVTANQAMVAIEKLSKSLGTLGSYLIGSNPILYGGHWYMIGNTWSGILYQLLRYIYTPYTGAVGVMLHIIIM